MAIGSTAFGLNPVHDWSLSGKSKKEIVRIVRIKDGNISKAVEKAIDLLGGIETVTRGKNRIVIKNNRIPNLW